MAYSLDLMQSAFHRNLCPCSSCKALSGCLADMPRPGHSRTACVVPLFQVIDFVRERLKAGESPKAICAQACDHCLAEDTEGCGKG